MTNKSISQLNAGSAVASTDLFPDVQTVGVGPVKVTAAQIGEYVLSGSGLTGILPVARGGTGLSTMTAANNALYSTSSSTIAAGTLPVAAGGTGLTSLTAGYIPFGNGTSAFGNSSNLFWDSANARLGIGTSSPSRQLHVYNTANDAVMLVSASTGYGGYIAVNSNGNSDLTGALAINQFSTGIAQINNRANAALYFSTNNTERMRIDSSGAVGFGQTALTGYGLFVGQNATGATTFYQTRSGAQIQSDVTTQYAAFYSGVATSAASFTLTNLYHCLAVQNVIGAGSAVTNQYGFAAAASLTGATNNYGFYSNIASGTGRWNFYANGTADNYFAGNTLIGSSSTVTSIYGAIGRFQVTGTNFSTSTTTLSRFSNDTGSAGINYVKSRATSVGSYAIVQSGDLLGSFYWTADNGVNYGSQAAAIDASVDGVPSSTSMPGRISFSTTAAGATSSTERLRIDSSGNVGIGAVPSAGYTLSISKNATGAIAAVGLFASTTIQSDVTSKFTANYTAVNTAAASFSIGSIRHYEAYQGTIGAGSAVTDQYGFLAGGSLTGATNNYGFFSNIASGTGRWNFYANGTAANLFGGVVEMKNVSSAPTSIAAGNGVLYVESGALKYRGSSGTVTTIAAA